MILVFLTLMSIYGVTGSEMPEGPLKQLPILENPDWNAGDCLDPVMFDENFGITFGYTSNWWVGVPLGFERRDSGLVDYFYHKYGFVTIEGQHMLGHPTYCWHYHLYPFYYSNIQVFNSNLDSAAANFKVTGTNLYWDDHTCAIDYTRFNGFDIQPNTD